MNTTCPAAFSIRSTDIVTKTALRKPGRFAIVSTIAACLAAISVHAFGSTPDPVPRLEVHPHIYLTAADVARLRVQAARPELSAAYGDLEAQTNKSIQAWRKKYPATDAPRGTAELLDIGKRDEPGVDFKTIATAFALHPTAELGQVLREKLMTRVGARQVHNYWREGGIHEGETAMAFLRAYDLISNTGVITADDENEIKDALHRCAHHLEGWTLDNDFSSPGWSGSPIYCLNFHTFSSSIMGTIAMMYPDFPESADWLRSAQSELPKLLFTEFGIDGGYGEGSMNYWHPTCSAMLGFMVASRNLGVHDYFADPSVVDEMRRTLAWRMNLMAPDGRCVAVGDGHRVPDGAQYFEEAGLLLNEPVFTWAGRAFMERTSQALIPAEPYDLFHIDVAAPAHSPEAPFANLPFSGYTTFRSGWGPRDHYLMLKYGTTFVGRREAENNLIISGHAHADALELELHYKGIPLLVDPGTVGIYQNWNTYGGYCKATVAHNTVGIGNRWGYDRLDGLYEEHVKQHGKEFLYETAQKNIGRSDTELKAWGDIGALGLISARLRTYADTSHERTVVWFRDTGVAVVGDRLESANEHTYEWYLNPVGKLLKQDRVLTFGDDAGKLDVVPVLPKDARTQIVSKDDPKVPPYYVALRPDSERNKMGAKGARHPFVAKDRWERFTLLVQQSKAKQTAFLNILVPYQTESPLTSVPLGNNGVKLTGSDSTLLVAGGGNDDPAFGVDGAFGVARMEKGSLTSYVLHHGHGLKMGNQELVGVKLLTEQWAPFFDSAATVAVSLPDRRASISQAELPIFSGLLMFSPTIEEGKEPSLPLKVAVTFRVDAKPKRIVARYSTTKMPGLNDPEFERKTGANWQPDFHAKSYLRETLDFTWDEQRQTVTVTVDHGIRQLVWE